MRYIAAIAMTIVLNGCIPYYVMEGMRMNMEARKAYNEYCASHMQECVDAYNKSMHVYVNR